MEWQLSGETSPDNRAYEPEGMLTEAEEIEGDLTESDEDVGGQNMRNGTVSKPESPVKQTK